jgi:hypothetical protein
MPEKLDPLSDLDVTKLRTTCPNSCSAKKQETKKLVKIAILWDSLARNIATYGGRTRARTWDPLIKSQQITLIYQAHFDISTVRSGIEPTKELENVEMKIVH